MHSILQFHHLGWPSNNKHLPHNAPNGAWKSVDRSLRRRDVCLPIENRVHLVLKSCSALIECDVGDEQNIEHDGLLDPTRNGPK